MSAQGSPERPAAGAVRTWVRVVDGRLVVTWQTANEFGWSASETRPLTLPERLAWWAARRQPKVGG